MLPNVLADRGLTNAGSVLKLLRYLSSYSSVLALSLMALTPQDIAQRAGEEAKNILGAVPGLAREGAALYVKEGTPSGPIPNIGVALARQACRRYADNPGGVPGGVAAAFEGVCRPYLDDIGYGQGPAIALPFRDGQCYGVNYGFDFTFTNNQGARQTLAQQTTGRLIGAYAVDIDGQDSWQFGFERQAVEGGPVVRVVQGTTFGRGNPNPVITGVTALDAGAGSCGNPSPVVRPPVPPPTPGPTREPFSPSPGTDIDIDVTIGPTGGITFNIGGPSITIDPFGGGGGDGGGSDNPGIDQPGTAPSSGLPPGDIGQPAAPVVTGPSGVASGCAPPNSVLVGIKVNILEPLPPVNQYDPAVYRGVCYAYMGTLGNLALNPEGVALRNGQMLFAPLDNLTCWEVRANVSFLLRVTPYYRALEAQEV